jgi:hypothetical protein
VIIEENCECGIESEREKKEIKHFHTSAGRVE